MKPFNINIGHQFAQPYESPYAMLRRCLSVNPGIPLSAIKDNLRAIDTSENLFITRLEKLQLNSDEKRPTGLDNSYQRQCPKCAQLLYHTNIYALPWLTHCPIHNCALATTCPDCEKKWPDENETSKRDCPTCGRLTWKHIQEHVIPGLKSMDYSSIGRIYKFISSPENKKSIHLFSYNQQGYTYSIAHRPWYTKIAFMNPQCPACQLLLHPEFSKLDLKTLNIKLKPMHYKSSDVYRADIMLKTINNQVGYYKKHILWDYLVMIRIIEWIHKNTPHNHELHLSDYLFLNLQSFVDDPEPCAYCLALCLWFNNTAWRIHDPFHYKKRPSYDYLNRSGFGEFFEVGEPCLMIENDGEFILSENFTEWFYCRSLELDFIDILSFIIELIKRTKQHKDQLKYNLKKYDSRYTFIDLTGLRKPLLDQHYAINLIQDKLFFFYENESPLNAYNPSWYSKTDTICEVFHDNYNAKYRDIYINDRLISSTGITRDVFIDMHMNFIKINEFSVHYKEQFSNY